MSEGMDTDQAVAAVRAAAGAAGDASGNCDSARYLVERGDIGGAAEKLEWAEENARSAMHRIKEAKAQLARLHGDA